MFETLGRALTSIANGIHRRNKIEEEKLNLQREEFEYSKKINEQHLEVDLKGIKSNEELVNTMGEYTKYLDKLNNAIETIGSNQKVLYERICLLEANVKALSEKSIMVPSWNPNGTGHPMYGGDVLLCEANATSAERPKLGNTLRGGCCNNTITNGCSNSKTEIHPACNTKVEN